MFAIVWTCSILIVNLSFSRDNLFHSKGFDVEYDYHMIMKLIYRLEKKDKVSKGKGKGKIFFFLWYVRNNTLTFFG